MSASACERSRRDSPASRSSFLSIPCGPKSLSQNTFGQAQVKCRRDDGTQTSDGSFVAFIRRLEVEELKAGMEDLTSLSFNLITSSAPVPAGRLKSIYQL